ncbi:T9SS type B sorting domain-containing protein [Myroides odoratus]|uniref:T9SS type B sorting domain-containing protein n=1 Tax=Myroides odoratus TaxID=256 RepID=UPI0039AEEE92
MSRNNIYITKKSVMKRFLFFMIFLFAQVGFAQNNPDPVLISNGRTNICSGILYDTGGVAGNYSRNETITMTLCPDTPGGSIRLEFTSFLLGHGASLSIFDGQGPGTHVPGSPFHRDNPIADGRLIAVENNTGCMTLVWTTDDNPTAPGFSAEITCNRGDCQVITPRLLRSIPGFAQGVEPACEEDLGVIRACIGEEIKVYGDASFSTSGQGAKYKWDFNNGVIQNNKNGVITYYEKGAYRVRFIVEDNVGCTKLVSLIIQVGENEADIDLKANKQSYCLGEPIRLEAKVNLREVEFIPEVPESNPVALPDGNDPVTGQPRFFYSYLEFNQFCASSVIETPQDIADLLVRITHTFMGDLDIILIAPNGAQVSLLMFGDAPATNQAADLGIPQNIPGVYNFSADAAETMRSINLGGAARIPDGTYLPANLPAGNSFNNLIGAPLNGIWTLRIQDKWGGDFGFLFGWDLGFDERFDLPDLTFQPEVASERWLPAPGLVETGTGFATVIQNVPGEYTYTYEVVDNFGCTFTEDIVVVVKDVPILGQIRNLQSCIDPVTGRVSFNLPDVNPSIGGNYDIKYYASEADANANRSPLGNTYAFNTTAGSAERTIWVRVTHNDTSCAVVDSFKVIGKRCTINLATLEDLIICRNLDGTVPNLDLTVQTPLVYFGNPNYTVTYYTSLANANNRVDRITDPANYAFSSTGNSETIYVRVENNSNAQEFSTTSFMLLVKERPVIKPLETLFACSIDDQKSIGAFNLDFFTARIASGPNLEVKYFTSLQGAIDDNASELIRNSSAYESRNGVAGYRVIDLTTGCFNYGTITLEVVELPELDEDVLLSSCSLSTTANGIGEFNLNVAIPMILNNGVDPRIEVTFYRSLANATTGTSPIDLSRNFVNDVPYRQTIYAKVSFNNTTCSEIVEVDLVVQPRVLVSERVEAKVCVENINREIILDLTTYELEILNGLPASEYEISYYISRNDANLKIRPISSPQHYSSVISRNVWVRVESRLTGCFGLSNLIIIPVQAPIIESLPAFSVCEDPSDLGFANFNLLDYMNSFLNGRAGLIVSFYATATDAQNIRNPLNSTNYRNITAYEQVIYVRFVSENGCATIKPLTLKAAPAPVLNIPAEPVGICSVTNNGIATFDLLALVTDLQNGNPSVIVNFFETEENAINNIDRIPVPRAYTNLNPGGATIYVRGELRGGCFVVKPLELIVISSPVLPINIDDLVLCSNDVLEDFAHFDLTVQDSVIKNAQTDPNNTAQNLEVKYFLSEVNANANVSAISIPTDFVNTSSNQVIWYRVYNKRSSCYAVGSFKLIVNKPLALNQPTDIQLCQPQLPNNGKAVFDLTIREIDILGRPIDRVTIKYYENQTDAKQDRNAIPNPRTYTNRSNPQTIWVGVTSFNGCRSFVSMVIRVNPIPDVNFNPRPIHSCMFDIATSTARFDLTSREYEIGNQSTGYYFEYFNTRVGAETQDRNDEILFPAAFVSVTTTVYLRIAVGKNAPCFVIVPLNIIVDELPRFDDITFLHCLENSTGFSTFNLLEKTDEILNGRDGRDYDIYFYVRKDDADLGNIGSAIPADYIYSNVQVGTQTIWVRVVSKLTGCVYVGPMKLVVEEKVFAFDIDLADKTRIEKCATPTGVTGFANFDLTLFTDEIKGTQRIPAADLSVTYYYNNVAIPVANLAQFRLPIGTHEIVAIVKQVKAGFVFLCEDEIRFTLTVFESPVAPILTGSILCVDYNTGKLVDAYTIDSGYKATEYDFQWEYRTPAGAFVAIPGATKSYYVVEDITRGNVFRVKVNYKGQICSTNSANVTLTFVEEIEIKVLGADSKGVIGALDGEERISIVIEAPTNSSVFEYALDEGAYQDSRVFYDVANGTHRVWVRYKDNRSICPQYMDVFILGYPKFFTPNGDGFNDTWNIPTLKGHPEAVIYIYDRYGKLLTQLSPAKDGWDGTFNGKPMPSTDYWFTVEYLEDARNANQVPRKVQFKGHFSLKR